MNRLHLRVGGLAVLAWGLLSAAAPAQDVKPADDENNGKADVQRLVIYNGSVRTVHYYGKGLSAAERNDLRDLEQAQNDVAMARYEQERPPRTTTTVAVNTLGGPAVTLGAPYYFPPVFAGDLYSRYLSNLNYILSDSMPAIPAALPYYGWGYSFYNPTPLPVAAVAPGPQVLQLGGTQATVTETSADQEPRMSLADAERRERAALARVNRDARLRTALNLPNQNVREAAHEEEARPTVTLTLKSGKTITGQLVRQDKDWMVLNEKDHETRVRRSEVAAISRATKANKEANKKPEKEPNKKPAKEPVEE